MKIIVIAALLCFVLAIDPPVYNFAYHINFDESWIVNKTIYEVNGQVFYDPKNNR